MSTTPVKLYNAIKPILGVRSRRLAHAVRRKLYGDTSQLGEALFAQGLVESHWPRFVVEVGANDGITASNSRLFVKAGWSALLIEPNPRLFPTLVSNCQAFPHVRCLQFACSDKDGQATLQIFDDDETGMLSSIQAEGAIARNGIRSVGEAVEVEVRTLTSILDEEAVVHDFSLLSIDTEGHDLEVIEGLEFDRYQPRCIITEIHADSEDQKRSILRTNGYDMVAEIGVNTIWLHGRQ